MKVKVRDLRPNPFRDQEHYPVNRDKVEALKTSFELTGVWPNLIARPSLTEPGKKELGYGVHRLTALTELHREDPEDPRFREIDITVRDISDTDMLLIMAHENMTEWSHSAEIDQETVRSVVLAYAAGKIVLPLVPNKATNTRSAPSFLLCARAQSKLLYTADTVARFLKWHIQKVQGALDALAAIEEELVTTKTFKDLGPRQAEVVTRETRRVQQKTGDAKLAGAIGNKLAEGMRQSSGRRKGKNGEGGGVKDVTTRNARQIADEMLEPEIEKPRQVSPEINEFARDLIDIIAAFLPEPLPTKASISDRHRRGQERQAKLQQVIDYREHLNVDEASKLRDALEHLAARLTGFADQLRTPLPSSNGKAPLPSSRIYLP